jgi:hypothetical protein
MNLLGYPLWMSNSNLCVCVPLNKPNPDLVCQDIMERLLKRGYSYQISQKDLRATIIRVRGMDKRTFKQWEETLILLEYIKRITPTTYEMNVTKVPRLFEILKNIPQTYLASSTHTQSST